MECEVCGESTTGRIRYSPLNGGQYVVCHGCAWRNGNIGDFVRVYGRLPSFEESQKRHSKIVAAVTPRSEEHYEQLIRFYLRTHPEFLGRGFRHYETVAGEDEGNQRSHRGK